MGINTFVCNKGALGYGAFAWKDGPDVRHIKGASGWGSCGRAEHPLKKQGLRGAPGMNALWALGAELGDTEQLLQEQKAVGCSTRSDSGRVFPGLEGKCWIPSLRSQTGTWRYPPEGQERQGKGFC